MEKQAIIYCRVSSQKQVTEGNGLASQETRCREFAKSKGYEVIDVFRDEGLSGKLLDRPNMKAMLTYIKKHKNKEPIVIIDDISRLARDIETHIHLRTAIADAGGKLESPSIEFGDDSDSRLVEHLLASVAAHQREKNMEQVSNRMRARMQAGYWCFYPPPGYSYEKVSGHGKLLVRDEPCASAIAEALTGFANGRFETQSEIKRFLEQSGAYNTDKKGKVHYTRIKDMLGNSLYAGYINKENWGLRLIKGQHEPLVSYETFQRIQERLQTQAKVPAKANINSDFPLRNFVTCGCCGSNMSSCWSKGRNEKYPYYLCVQKGCAEYRKSIRKEQIEGEFEKLLTKLKPPPEIFFAMAEIFTDLWNEKILSSKERANNIRKEIISIERKTEQLMDRIVEAESPTLIAAYEKKVKSLEEEKIRLDEKIAKSGRPMASFEETFRTAFSFLSNPQKLWQSGRLDYQRTVLKLVFSDKLKYCKNEGFRTASIAQPIRLLAGNTTLRSEMVEPVGLEPTTSTLPELRSTR